MKKHKLTVFARGNTFNCYLDLTLDECKARDERYEKNKSENLKKLEAKTPLQIHEYEFDDEFQLWTNVADDVNQFVNNLLEDK